MLFGFRRLQQKPFINDQQDRVGIFRLNFFVCAVITCQLQLKKQIWKPDIFRLVTLLAGFHPKCTGQIGLPTPGSSGDKEVPVFCDIFTGCKPFNQRSVQLASGSIIDISNIGIRLVKPGTPYQAFQAVALAVAVSGSIKIVQSKDAMQT